MVIFVHTKNRAVTLFEMLLVLFVASLIMLAAFKYEQVQTQNAVADALAEKMYLFSQTVRMFEVNNKAAFAAGTFVPSPAVLAPSTFTVTGNAPNKTYVFTGVAWLTNPALTLPNSTTPYLQSSFTFNGLAPLSLQRDNLKGDDAVQVTITATSITILYGNLYDATDTTKPPQVKGAITANAAHKASSMSDPMMGPSVFSYQGGLDAQGKPVPILATLLPSTSLQTQLANPVVSGGIDLGGGTGSSPDNGVIKDVSAIQFNDSVPGQTTAITGVDSVSFSSSVPGQVNNVNAVDFTDTGGVSSDINNLDNLNFDPTQGSTDVINNLMAINFQPGGSTSITNLQNLQFQSSGGVMTNVQSITFVPGGLMNNISTINFDTGGAGRINKVGAITFSNPQAQKFQGFGTTQIWSKCYTDDCNQSSAVNNFATGFYTSQYICTLNYVKYNDGNSNANRICNLQVGPQGQYVMHFEYALACGMLCFPFNDGQP